MSLRLCTICARGGSKGVPGKNIRLLLGKPLIAYSVEQAIESTLFDKIAVSSDSDEILDAAKKYGADVLIKRPDELAGDSAGKLEAIRHAVLEAERQLGKKYDTFVDMDATSPLRIVEDIKNAVALLEDNNISSVMTATPARHSPYFNILELSENGEVFISKKPRTAVLSRQSSPKCYDMNASIYVWAREPFLSEPSCFYPNTKLLIMPDNRSVDIDSELDFTIVETIMQKNKHIQEKSYAI